MKRYGKPVLERFWSKVKVGAPDECWPWLGANINGYGRFCSSSTYVVSAPQFTWELEHAEPFPEGMDSAHSCNNPACVNPAHISPQTRQENITYAGQLGRLSHPAKGWNNRKKTHCPHGHEYTMDNILWDRGSRRCRICNNNQDRQRRANAKRKAAGLKSNT